MSPLSDFFKCLPDCSEIQVEHNHQVQKTLENVNPLLLQAVHCTINNNNLIESDYLTL